MSSLKFFGSLFVPVFFFFYPFAAKAGEPLPFEQRDEWRLSTEDGASLFVREFGRGDTVLVLHGGWGAEHSYLMEAFLPLADNYHFIFYDQRGSLHSPCPDSLISVDNHIEDVEEVRKAFGIDKILIAGHSMGGFLAMSYFGRYPDNVKGLVLISSPPPACNIKMLTDSIEAPGLLRFKRAAVIDTLKANGLSGDNQKVWTSMDKRAGLWHRITFASINLHDMSNWRSVRSAFFYQNGPAMIAASTSPKEWDFRKTIGERRLPLAIIHGDDDFLPMSYHVRYSEGLPGAELKIIKDAGHLIWIDKPDSFREALLESLKKCR